MHCSSCGTSNPIGIRFCGECGTSLATTTPTSVETHRRVEVAEIPSVSQAPSDWGGGVPMPVPAGGALAAPANPPLMAAASAPQQMPTAAPVINIVNQQSGGSSFNPALLMTSDKSPGAALVIGMLFTGAGQAYNGQWGKAAAFFFGSIVLWFMLLGWIVHIAAFIEAYMAAKKMRMQWQMALMGAGQGGGQVARLG